MTILTASLVAVRMIAVHLFSGRLRFLQGDPRSVWLPLADVSVAYVFVHLLSELAEGQGAIAQAAGEGLVFLDVHAYLVGFASSTGCTGSPPSRAGGGARPAGRTRRRRGCSGST